MPRILLIDDDAWVRELLADFIQQNLPAVELIEAEDGAVGIELLTNESFDLVITDIRMPQQDGFAVVKYLAKQGIDTPVIMISGSWTESQKTEAQDLYLHAMMEKPVDFDSFVATVKSALQME